jgi:hypothetical protein
MTGEIDHTSLVAGSKVVSGAVSNTASTSSSSNTATQTMAKKEVPMLYEYWKASMITRADLATYHAAG